MYIFVALGVFYVAFGVYFLVLGVYFVALGVYFLALGIYFWAILHVLQMIVVKVLALATPFLAVPNSQFHEIIHACYDH